MNLYGHDKSEWSDTVTTTEPFPAWPPSVPTFVLLAERWEQRSAGLAPPDDWGVDIAATVWADCLRACAAELRKFIERPS